MSTHAMGSHFSHAAILLLVFSLGGCGKSADQRAAEEAALQQRVKIAAQAELDADQKTFRAIASGAQPTTPTTSPNDKTKLPGVPAGQALPKAPDVNANGVPPQPDKEEGLTPGAWLVGEREDPMGRGTSQTAALTSTNFASLQFPHSPGTRANILLLRKKEGKGAGFSVSKGQLYCLKDDCAVNVKFDDGVVEKLKVTMPSGGGSSMMVVDDYSTFIAKLGRASTLKLELPFYSQGTRVFEFKVPDLPWRD